MCSSLPKNDLKLFQINFLVKNTKNHICSYFLFLMVINFV